MLATMEQTKIDQLPTVTFDEEELVINATVIISPGGQPGTYRHHVAALSAAGPTGSVWTVIWTLETVGPIEVKFPEGGGIDITSLPGAVHLQTTTPDLQPNQRHITFTNNVSDVNVIRYDLVLTDLQGNPLTKAADIIIDPTITVVKEPVDG